MVVYDRTVGGVLLLLNTVFIVYYVLWILVTPFVDASHFTQQWFPLREYGIALATLVMAVGFSLNATLASYHVLRRTGFDVRQLEGEEQRERAKRANYAAAMELKTLPGQASSARPSMATLQKLEPLVRLAELVLRDPRKIIQSSVAEVATALYYLACETQKSTAGRSLSAREKVSLLSSAIQETEWLAELLWRHNYGNRSAWRNTLRLQIVKSMLDLSVRYELFLLPWVWVTLKGKLIGVEGDAERGPDAVVQIPAADGDSSLSNALADKVPGAHPSPPAPGAVAVLPSSLPTRTKGKYGIVIPRVASQSCSSRAFHMHINWLDVLGMIVDLYQTVRPVVAVGLVAATSVHATPCPQVSQLLRGGVDTQAASTESMLRCISNLTASDSLLSDWRTWMIICCLDIATLLIAQFVKRRRVPVVMINAGDPDGTKPIAERDADGPPQSPVVPQGEAADGGLKITTVTVGQVPHRDQLRVKQALRLLGSSFLRDPFFTVMVKPIIMKLVSSRLVSRIPLFGSIFAHHAAYSMLLQHLSFLYTIGH